MTPTDVLQQDHDRDFDPENVLELYFFVSTDWWYLSIEDWTGGVITNDHPDVSQYWDEVEEAVDALRHYRGLYDLYYNPKRSDSELREAFPPWTRGDLEVLVARAVGAMRAHRDALKSAVQRRLTRTAIPPDTFVGADLSTIAEAVPRLRADRENLSDVVTTFFGPHGDNPPEIIGLWSEAEKAYLDLELRIEPGFPRLASLEHPSDEPAPPTELPPTQIAGLVAELGSLCEQFQSVRVSLLSAIEDGLAISVEDYDPNWASHSSPVIFKSGPLNATNPEA